MVQGVAQPSAMPQGPQAATLAEAQAGTYVLRAGDSLALSFRLSPELNQTAIIDPDGSISLELIGRVQVAGMTVSRAREVILEKESQHLVRPELNLQLTNFQHFYVVVAGEVYLPQKLEMREEMTALQAVLLSGGIKISGRETQVLLYRRVNSERSSRDVPFGERRDDLKRGGCCGGTGAGGGSRGEGDRADGGGAGYDPGVECRDGDHDGAAVVAGGARAAGSDYAVELVSGGADDV